MWLKSKLNFHHILTIDILLEFWKDFLMKSSHENSNEFRKIFKVLIHKNIVMVLWSNAFFGVQT